VKKEKDLDYVEVSREKFENSDTGVQVLNDIRVLTKSVKVGRISSYDDFIASKHVVIKTIKFIERLFVPTALG
jgi:hypothetical protein